MKETRYIIEKRVTEGPLIVDQTTVSLKWRKEAPTKEGWYLAVADVGILSAPEFVHVIEYFPGEFAAERTGTDETTHLDLFARWLGPFPTFGEQE